MDSDGSRVDAILRAALVSAEIGRMARLATARPARNASTVPPSTPAPRNSQTRLIVRSTTALSRPYCRYARATTPRTGTSRTAIS